jgi:hypothetical protein
MIRGEDKMNRDRPLKVVLVVVGLVFAATLYPILAFRGDETLQMMLSLYVTLGIFLLLASRNPSSHRSLIAFAAWSSLAHAAVMTVQSFYDVGERMHLLLGSLVFGIIGAVLIVLAPAKAASAYRDNVDHLQVLGSAPSSNAPR